MNMQKENKGNDSEKPQKTFDKTFLMAILFKFINVIIALNLKL